MRIGGFVPLSTIDWPGQLVATIFTRGCPWDCPYCHNPHLLTGQDPAGETAPTPTWPEIRAFLAQRRGLLDGVVFSGGEPTAQSGLGEALAEARALGFRTALHTGGSLPDRFEALLPLLDWVGFDVKAPFSEYDRVTRREGSGAAARRSLQALVASEVPFEVRTTLHPDLLDEHDLRAMAHELKTHGVRHWFIQLYRSEGVREGVLAPWNGDADVLPHDLGVGFETFGVRG